MLNCFNGVGSTRRGGQGKFLYSHFHAVPLDERPPWAAAVLSVMGTLHFEDVELQDAAQAARAAAVRADADAEKQSNPTIRAMFDSEARRVSGAGQQVRTSAGRPRLNPALKLTLVNLDAPVRHDREEGR